MKRILIAALAALIALPCAALAGRKPALSVKTETLEVSVDIDDALRAYPTLRAFILAETRRDVLEDKRRTKEEHQQGERPYSVYLEYTLRSVVGSYISVLRREIQDMGGAHPNTYISSTIWKHTANRPCTFDDFFVDTRTNGDTMTRLADLVRDAIAVEKRRRFPNETETDDSWRKKIEPSFDTLGSPTLEPSTVPGKAAGMTFHFSPYDVGAFGEGSYAAFVRWQPLLPLVEPELRVLFGGERKQYNDRE